MIPSIERDEFDGPVSVQRIGVAIVATCCQGRLETTIEMSEYNARRILAMLSVVLQIPLGKDGQRIKL